DQGRRRRTADRVVEQQHAAGPAPWSSRSERGERAVQGDAHGELLAAGPLRQAADVLGGGDLAGRRFKYLDREPARPRALVEGVLLQRHALRPHLLRQLLVDDPLGVGDEVGVAGTVEGDAEDLLAGP